MTTDNIAIIGGTGAQGRGLARRLALAGRDVLIGSRSADRAATVADDLLSRGGNMGGITGTSNYDAAAKADVVILAVPYDGHAELVESLRDALDGKVVISCVNPLGFDRHGPYGLAVKAGSAAEEAAELLPGSTVVGAFHHVSAVLLMSDKVVDEDVLVCGDESSAKNVAIELAEAITGRKGVDAGPLRIARQLEPLTAVLISINKRYKTHAGIRVTGLA